MLRDNAPLTLSSFIERYTAFLHDNAQRPEVVGFKSVACYRTGLDVALSGVHSESEIAACLPLLNTMFRETGKVRLAQKPINDRLVRICVRIAAEYDKPGTVHTPYLLRIVFVRLHIHCSTIPHRPR